MLLLIVHFNTDHIIDWTDINLKCHSESIQTLYVFQTRLSAITAPSSHTAMGLQNGYQWFILWVMWLEQ
jgi:hypothetical protein